MHGFGHSLHRKLDAAGGAVWNPFPNPSSCILVNGSSLMLPLAFGAFAREQAFYVFRDLHIGRLHGIQ